MPRDLHGMLRRSTYEPSEVVWGLKKLVRSVIVVDRLGSWYVRAAGTKTGTVVGPEDERVNCPGGEMPIRT